MAKKHKLTKKTDHIDGVNGKDLFNAPMFLAHGHERATLSNKDVLNGRGGIDTIKAFIAADSLKPKLKNIEKAIFTRHDEDELSLNLARSAKLNNIQLKDFVSDVAINHAARLGNFTINGMDGHAVTIDGINTARVANARFNFTNAVNTTLDVQTVKDLAFKAMTVTLKDSTAIMTGDITAGLMTVHSKGGANQLGLDPLVKTQKMVIDGDASLVLAPIENNSFLVEFDAFGMTADLQAEIGGSKLVSVKTGSGNDTLVLTELGGAMGEKAVVDLGAGDDNVDLTHVTLDGDLMAIDGGEGVDTATIYGNPGNVSAVLSSFESLKITKAEGSYDLTGSGIQTVEFLSDADGNNDLAFNYDPTATGGLKSVDGSALSSNMTVNAGGVELAMVKTGTGNDNVTIGALGGTEADKALVDLGAGDDMLDVTGLALDSARRFLDGGDGVDTLTVAGVVDSLAGSPLFENFEHLEIKDAQGKYEISDNSLETITVSDLSSGVGAEIVYSPESEGALTDFDASMMEEAVKAVLWSLNLQSVQTGKGDDEVHLGYLGGDSGGNGYLNLGDGDDRLDISEMLIGPGGNDYFGGAGNNTVTISGNIATPGMLFTDFQTLEIKSAEGIYDLAGGGITTIKLLDDQAGPVIFGDSGSADTLEVFDASAVAGGVFALLDSTALSTVTLGSGNDYLKIDALSAVMADVDLGDGDDNLDLTDIAQNPDIHHFSGGDGNDAVFIKGGLFNVTGLLGGFETLTISEAIGNYDLSNSGIGTVVIDSADSANNSVMFKYDPQTEGGLQELIAENLTCDLVATIGGGVLTLVKTGSGNDDITILQTGGDIDIPAMIDLGAGNDELYVVNFDGYTQAYDGGDGYDTAYLAGPDKYFAHGLNNFEALKINDATGSYDFNESGLSTIELNGSGPGVVNINSNLAGNVLEEVNALGLDKNLIAKLGGDNLALVMTGSGNDVVQIIKMATPAAGKSTVDLGNGNDRLDLTSLVLDPAKQEFKGGNGVDTAIISGALNMPLTSLIDFEVLEIEGANGDYDLSGSGLEGVVLTTAPTGPNKYFYSKGASNDLKSFNSSSLDSGQICTVNSTSLEIFQAGKGNDYVSLGALGGNVNQKATVNMGAGDDILHLEQITLDPTKHALDGGAGFDTAVVVGALSGIAELFENFERLYINVPSGSYDMQNSGFTAYRVSSISSDLTLDNLASGSRIQILGAATSKIAFKVENAVLNTSDALTIEFGQAAGDVGSAAGGVLMTGLSHLTLESIDNASHTFYLGSLGGSGIGAATMDITGNSQLIIKAATGSSSYIDEINITNNAGVDLLGLLNGTKAIVATGASITGGNGSDVLIGGDGGDLIHAGHGTDVIHASKGADAITLGTLASDQATIVYSAANQSTGTVNDTLYNFGASDRIDIGALTGKIDNFANVTSDFSGQTTVLQSGFTNAYFDQQKDMLVIDLDQSGAFSADDLKIHLDNVVSLSVDVFLF